MSFPPTEKAVTSLLEARFSATSYFELDTIVRRFVDDALAYASRTIGTGDLREAWDVFRAWLSTGIDPSCEDWRLFVSWYVFHWHSQPGTAGAPPELPSVAERYLRDRPELQTPAVHMLVKSAVSTPVDFYEIHYLPEFERFYLKSLFLGYQHSFGFEELPPGLEVGNVYLAKIVHLYADQGVIAGISPALGAQAKVAVAYLRRSMIKARSTDFTRDFWLFDSDVFNVYYDLLRQAGGNA